MTEPTPASAPSASRAGRNLPAAIAVGVAMGLVVLVSLFTVKWLFAVVATVAVGIAVVELSQAFTRGGVTLARTPLYIGTVVMVPMAYLFGVTGQAMVFGLIVVAAMIWRIRLGVEGYVKDMTATVFVAAYLPFMLGFAMHELAAPLGPQLIVVFIAVTITNDIGGYFTGIFLGKHPIAPGVSPKKSWEGFAGSLTFCAALGAVLFWWLLGAPWWQGLVFGAILAVTATSGDFAESAIKRDLGVKDLGSILPGHGGLMDRLDSLIPNAFVSWLLFTIFGLIPVTS